MHFIPPTTTVTHRPVSSQFRITVPSDSLQFLPSIAAMAGKQAVLWGM